MKTSRFSLLIGLLILFQGLGVVSYYSLRSSPPPNFTLRLLDLLPASAELPDWHRVAEEIAASPEMKRAVAELLNYDDAVFFNYSKGQERVSIYIAHWKPGTMSQRLVSGHTPDVCWVGNGWEIRRRESRISLDFVSGPAAQAAEWREMALLDNTEFVLFWHLVGGESRDLSSPVAPWHAFLTEMFSGGMRQREEQFFIRISSNRSDAGWGTEVVARFVSRLRAAGVPL
jgi:hypothetical protein